MADDAPTAPGGLRVSRWTGEFVRREDEEAYRLAVLKEAVARNRVIALGGVILTVLFAIADRSIVAEAAYYEVLALRVAGVLPMVIFGLAPPPRGPWWLPRLTFAAALWYVTLMVVVATMLPPRPVALTIWTALILMIYLLPPLRMWAAITLASVIFAAIVAVVPLPWPIDHPETVRGLMMILGVNVLGALTLRALERGRRAEFALLSRTLPRSVIPRLRRGERVVDHVDEASILFADLVGFSSRSATMKTADVLEMLEELFAAIDVLTAKHGAEKIKTIGDCYMAAAGIPEPRPDHARVLARLALDMVAMVESRSFAGHKLRLRIGLHCGPVAAGIIGHDRFLYDVWGETVNTAQRMESRGLPGVILVTPGFAVKVMDEFELVEHGEVNLKDGSQCLAYRLVAERPASASASASGSRSSLVAAAAEASGSRERAASPAAT
ncbi:MAG: hypothetical protein H6710_19380 [Myxococcales bacterium]|nr:hypothetical protein [Myxococcales bacterium]